MLIILTALIGIDDGSGKVLGAMMVDGRYEPEWRVRAYMDIFTASHQSSWRQGPHL